MHHPSDRITHTTAFVTPVMEHWLERVIAQWVHPMKDRSNDPSHHERRLLPRSYISLLPLISQCALLASLKQSSTFNHRLLVTYFIATGKHRVPLNDDSRFLNTDGRTGETVSVWNETENSHYHRRAPLRVQLINPNLGKKRRRRK